MKSLTTAHTAAQYTVSSFPHFFHIPTAVPQHLFSSLQDSYRAPVVPIPTQHSSLCVRVCVCVSVCGLCSDGRYVPVVEDRGQRQEAAVSNVSWSRVAAVNHPVQQSLSVLVELQQQHDCLLYQLTYLSHHHQQHSLTHSHSVSSTHNVHMSCVCNA